MEMEKIIINQKGDCAVMQIAINEIYIERHKGGNSIVVSLNGQKKDIAVYSMEDEAVGTFYKLIDFLAKYQDNDVFAMPANGSGFTNE
jgi:hypothetical protein